MHGYLVYLTEKLDTGYMVHCFVTFVPRKWTNITDNTIYPIDLLGPSLTYE